MPYFMVFEIWHKGDVPRGQLEIGFLEGLAEGFRFWAPHDRTAAADAIVAKADELRETLP